MLERIIEWSAHNRFLVLIMTALVAAGGVYSLMQTPIDAIPDLSDVQVIIQANWEGQSPQEIEDQVTYPLTSAMLGVPNVKVVRGYSFFGFSLVYVIFEDGTDLYWARSRVLEYLSYVQSKLPEGVTSTLGPDATGVGWVYEYALTSDRHSLGELRAIQDWYLRYQLTTVKGVSEVATLGGSVMQYQVEIDPDKLRAYGIPLKKVRAAIKSSNRQVGGRLLEMADREYMVRGLGYIESLEDLRLVPIGATPGGTAILLGDVANVGRGPDIRRGVAELDGEGEVVGGVIVMRSGENPLDVIHGVEEKLKELKLGLPEGVEIITTYNRADLIHRAIETLKRKLLEESIVVAVVCVVFLFHLPSALVAIITLPMGILMAYIIMHAQGINANIMSLGGIAIAIGAMVDAAIVMIENAHKKIEHEPDRDRTQVIIEAAQEVGPALFFSLLIITVSFFPVFILGGQSGRLFKPLAFTKTYAMASGALLSVTLVPVLMTMFIRGRLLPEKYNPINAVLIFLYHPVIWLVLRLRWLVVAGALVVLLLTVYPLSRTGSEFMPPINEGDILYMPTTFPGISITEAKRLLQIQDKILKSFPEVKTVFGKIGRAESATDPAPIAMVETTIQLKPRDEWRPFLGGDIKKLMKEMDRQLQLPGLTNAWTMPIKTRIDMLATGIKTPIGVKVFGADLETIEGIAVKVEVAVQKVPGTLSAIAERATGGNYVDYDIDRQEAARYGLTVGDIQDVIMTAVGGMNITTTVEGRERFPVNLRYSRELRDNPDALRDILVTTPAGAVIPLGQVATIRIHQGPPAIKSENSLLMSIVYVDIEGVDLGTYVQEARKVVEAEVGPDIPPGYYISWSGQYEYMLEANKKLQVAIPVALIIILLLLYFNFKNVTDTLIVMLSLPFGVVGGIWLLYLWPQVATAVNQAIPWLALPAETIDFSIAVGVGFIALAGVAAETGVIMLIYLDIEWKKALRSGATLTRKLLWDAIIHGAVMRVRPKVMTVAAIMAGLIPLLIGDEVGSRVMRRIAAPMVGGMVSSTVLTLVVIPALYAIIKEAEINWHRWRGTRPEAD